MSRHQFTQAERRRGGKASSTKFRRGPDSRRHVFTLAECAAGGRVSWARCMVLWRASMGIPIPKHLLGEVAAMRSDEFFYHVWRILEACGLCDGLGGGEYRRVKQEWRAAGCPAPVAGFILERARVPPAGKGEQRPGSAGNGASAVEEPRDAS